MHYVTMKCYRAKSTVALAKASTSCGLKVNCALGHAIYFTPLSIVSIISGKSHFKLNEMIGQIKVWKDDTYTRYVYMP